MDVHQTIIISASLGRFDNQPPHVHQSLKHDFHLFTDENFPPRDRAMTPRLQAKIPKFFGWQLKPGYEYYMWLDGNICLTHPDTLKLFYDSCEGHDIVVVKHPRRPNIRQEARYLRKGLNQQSRYILGRYLNEWTPEQVDEFSKDKTFVDDLMVLGGIFFYKDTPAVREMFKEWWYFTTRYSVFDQLSFAYVLKRKGLKVKVIEQDLTTNKYFKPNGHRYHDK